MVPRPVISPTLALRAAWSTNCSVVRALMKACSRACCSMRTLPCVKGNPGCSRVQSSIATARYPSGGDSPRRQTGETVVDVADSTLPAVPARAQAQLGHTRMIGVEEVSGRRQQGSDEREVSGQAEDRPMMSADDVAGELERFDPTVRTIVAAR